MKNRMSFLWLGCILLCITSCTTLQTVSFDRLQAADINFPEQIRRVGVVNAMPVLDKEMERKVLAGNVLEGDGSLSAETLAREVAATNYFEEVVICDSAVWQQSLPMSGSLPVALVDSLVQTLDVDMLLVMERVHIQLQEGWMFTPEVMMTLPAIDGVVAPLLRGYVAGRNVPLFTISQSDTICWIKEPSLTFDKIVKEASEYAAILPMEKLLPHWVEVERNYFDGGGVEMRDAGVYVREQNWEEAVRLWKQVLDREKGKSRMRAAYNLALYCEVCENFEEAKEYLKVAASCVSEDSYEGQMIKLYQVQLDALSAQNRALRLQMKRFE